MSSLFQTVPEHDADAATDTAAAPNPWMIWLGVLAGVLLLAGVITVMIGLGGVANFEDVVLGQSEAFDQAVATAVVGGVAILLGVMVGTCWLVLGAIGWRRLR